ncbi:hypothetical protein HC761_01700 [bacterium]|nr:hypothetical protein [bacterium]
MSANGGPSHALVPGLFLGTNVDAESNGQPDSTAAGDNSAGSNDETGLVSTTLATAGTSTSARTLTFNATAPLGVTARLNVFVDRNGDGDFNDPSEQGTVDFVGTGSSQSVSVVLPARASVPAFTAGGIVGMRAACIGQRNGGS